MVLKISDDEGADCALRDSRARCLQGHHALRRWMQKYPELFGSKAQVDCFIAIALLTTHSDTIPSLNSLYRSLPCAENSVRSYVRSLAVGGWISFMRNPDGDRRSTGLRLEPPILQVQDEYFALLNAIGAETAVALDTEFDSGSPDIDSDFVANNSISA